MVRGLVVMTAVVTGASAVAADRVGPAVEADVAAGAAAQRRVVPAAVQVARSRHRQPSRLKAGKPEPGIPAMG